MYPLETRDVCASSVIRECRRGNGVDTFDGGQGIWLDSPMIEALHGEGTIEKYPAQNKAFIEVKSGAIDFAVMDIVLAQNICGKGDYEDLMIVEDIVLDSEIYAIGFPKGSELTAKVNDAIKTLFDNGTMAALATKYGFENTVQLCETIE